MIKNISSARSEYKFAYGHLRMGSGYYDDDKLDLTPQEIIDCASLSYDNRDERFSGWVNLANRIKWNSRKAELDPLGGIPF